MTTWIYEWERRMTPLVASAILNSWTYCPPAFSEPFDNQLFVADKHRITAYFGAESIDRLGKKIQRRIVDESFLYEYRNLTDASCRRLLEFIPLFADADDSDPVFFDRFFRTYWECSCPVVTIRSFNRVGTANLESYLSSVIPEVSKRNEAMALLTSPVRHSLSFRERQDFDALLDIYLWQRKNPQARGSNFSPKFRTALDSFISKWSWFPCGYDNEPPWDEAIVLDQLSYSFDRSSAPSLPVSEVREKRSALLEKLSPPAALVHVADALSEFTYYKDVIREHLNQFQFAMQPYLCRVSGFLGLSDFGSTDLFGWETQHALETGKPYRGPLVGTGNYVLGVEGGIRFSERGAATKAFVKKRLGSALDSSAELIGVCANPGKIEGKVCVIHSAKDYTGQTGFVLVAPMTTPELMPAMKKAAAIVTDEGGITCHAAIVARELGIPCVVGVKIATKVLKNGDTVEVDATAGTVKKTS